MGLISFLFVYLCFAIDCECSSASQEIHYYKYPPLSATGDINCFNDAALFSSSYASSKLDTAELAEPKVYCKISFNIIRSLLIKTPITFRYELNASRKNSLDDWSLESVDVIFIIVGFLFTVFGA